MRWILSFIFSFSVLGCSTAPMKVETDPEVASSELLSFAKVNCFFWYFKKKGYDLEDIRNISGGIVEMGSLSSDKYQKTSFLVKEYSPNIETKKDVDLDLAKCFVMEEDLEFLQLLNSM